MPRRFWVAWICRACRITDMSEPKKHPSDCGNCRFWKGSRQLDPDTNGEFGCCRRHGPLLVMIGAMQTTRWPRTDMSDWCGDWDHMDNTGPGIMQEMQRQPPV